MNDHVDALPVDVGDAGAQVFDARRLRRMVVAGRKNMGIADLGDAHGTRRACP